MDVRGRRNEPPRFLAEGAVLEDAACHEGLRQAHDIPPVLCVFSCRASDARPSSRARARATRAA